MTDIASQLQAVRERIRAAALRAHRRPEDITLVAVSKTKPLEAIEAAYAAGQRIFGENYAQELETKALALKHLPAIEWHFIGHLQSNKCKQVVPYARAIHTIDSEKLAVRIANMATHLGRAIDVLIEVNVESEVTKVGVAPSEVAQLCAHIQGLSSIHVRGLMSIPAPHDDPKDCRPAHRRLREIRDASGGAGRLPWLSMGMTDDLEIAIEEGATHVRVGTAIFGARTYAPSP
jgi:hypothetical protein